MKESENHNEILDSVYKLDRELRRSLSSFQGYIHALEEENLNAQQTAYLLKLQQITDKITRKVNSFRKIIELKSFADTKDQKTFHSGETVESFISMLKIDFPDVIYQADLDSKILPLNDGSGNTLIDMIHGVAVLLLQHGTQKLKLKLRLSQIIDDVQFIDLNLEAENCTLSVESILASLESGSKSKVINSRFATTLSLDLSKKLLHDKNIIPEVFRKENGNIIITLYDRWKIFTEVAEKAILTGLSNENQPLHILIVEDDTLNQMVTQMMIQNYGWSSDIASNGKEALELFDIQKHDCVLMDIEMPVMDGLECTHELRKKYGKRVPIIALTATSENQLDEVFFSKGLDNFLVKPVKKDLLYSKIKMSVDLKNSEILT